MTEAAIPGSRGTKLSSKNMLRWPHPKKRLRPEEATLSRSKKAVFEDVHIFLVERKMGRSRRSFLTQLARSKGFVVEDVLRLEKAYLVLL